MKVKVEIEVEIPDGWKFIRYGPLNEGDMYTFGKEVKRAPYRCGSDFVVVERDEECTQKES